MKTFQHKFVDIIPDTLSEGVLYISIKYCTAVHKCACGCGNEVVTPISKNGWSITFNGKDISLHPSVGSFNLECQSHYWIIHNKIRKLKRGLFR